MVLAVFRPCIDLHEGVVKQIVGGTLDGAAGSLRTNFVSERPAAWYAALYRRDGLQGGHVIKLGPGNDPAARSALEAYPGGLQIGGGINADNARGWLEAGASHVIVTSALFKGAELDPAQLEALRRSVGKGRLVLDLSCRKREGRYWIVKDLFQTFTKLELTRDTLEHLSSWCCEFLVHAVDVEGQCRGIDRGLVSSLAEWCPIPVTYAGGARSLADLKEVTRTGRGRIHLTIGSALDIFGGTGVKYEDAVAFNRDLATRGPASAPSP